MRTIKNTPIFFIIVVICLLLPSVLHADLKNSQPSQKTIIEDMAGRRVAVSGEAKRVVTLGSVPAINTFIFAVGKGYAIANGLPAFARSPYWKYQTIFAPDIKGRFSIQGSGGPVNVEVLSLLSPDVVFTTSHSDIDYLSKHGLTTIYLDWKRFDPMYLMRMMGKVFNRRKIAEEYAAGMESRIEMIASAIKGIPQTQRQKVIFCRLPSLAIPSGPAGWAITRAGGITMESSLLKSSDHLVQVSVEQLVLWNPDILIVWSKEEVAQAYKDGRLSLLNAVKQKRVYAVPVGAAPWLAPTPEQYLGVLWAAKLFYPKQFDSIDLVAETKDFYRKFFGYSLTNKQAVEMINGGSDG
jgi:iron complex transport system substrate-binding protein